MKRIVCAALAVALLVPALFINCYAVEEQGEIVVAEFDDGSYMTEVCKENLSRASGSKTGSKTRTYYDGNGVVVWKAVLTGTFTYTGTSSTCTSSSCSASISDSAWYVVSKSASKSSNVATASVTMGEKVLGVTVSKVSFDLTLTCDANGNLS